MDNFRSENIAIHDEICEVREEKNAYSQYGKERCYEEYLKVSQNNKIESIIPDGSDNWK